MEIMNVDTKKSIQNSDSREHSRNLLESVAGRASDQMNQQRSVGKTIGPKLLKGKDTGEETSRKLVHRTLNKGT